MKISIIIPAYNAQATIEDCLKSAMSQSVPQTDCEVILVDDGSTDKTATVAGQFDVRIMQQKNSGPAQARNRGAQEAKGAIVVFVDADCIMDSLFLEKITAPFNKDSAIVGVQGKYRTVQHELIAVFAQKEIEERYERMQKRATIDFIGTYAAAYRRDIFLKFEGFDTTFPIASGEDTDFSFRLAREGYAMVFEPEALVEHRHPDTLLCYLKQKYWRAYWRNLIYKKKSVKGNQRFLYRAIV